MLITIQITQPQSFDELKPNYAYFALAPCWSRSQATCLLCKLATIDKQTLNVLITLKNDSFRKKFRSLQDEKSCGKGPKEYQDFIDYVTWEFPVPLQQTYRLSNIYELIEGSFSGKKNLDPIEIVNWAITKGITPPIELEKGFLTRQKIDYLSLPNEPFLDEINFSERMLNYPNDGKIKLYDPNAAKKYMRYVPHWA